VSVERSICPDIYHPAIARDGLLTRLRIPGGMLNGLQCEAIEQLLTATGLDYIQVTNRANLQLRALTADLDQEVLTALTDCGLAASDSAVDGIRNIMLSPTAGIDGQELIDVRPLAAAWHDYLTNHPELGSLSTKFSVGFDGGGSVGIVDRPNDITLLAVSSCEFELYLGLGVRGSAPVPVGVRLGVAECLPMLAAIAQTYRQGIELFGGDARRKPRLRDVIQHWGLTGFSEIVQREFTGTQTSTNPRRSPLAPLQKGGTGFLVPLLGALPWSGDPTGAHPLLKGDLGGSSDVQTSSQQFFASSRELADVNAARSAHDHLGVHPQRQPDRYYLGVVLPLGRWNLAQIKGVGEIANRYGSGAIRLTPWQNMILPDIQANDLERVQGLITDLGLIHTANHPSSLLRACAGSTGCQFGATDTQRDAIELSNYLAANFQLDRPLNIHFSGCDKSCAQHDRADITLWGDRQDPALPGSYRISIAGISAEFAQELNHLFTPAQAPITIGKAIDAYHYQRLNPQESFQDFITRQSLAQLHQIFFNVV
jgi:ferredoxin-nitrite reductase